MFQNMTKLRSRPPIARMVHIHELLQQNKYPNCRKIAEEIEVAPRTIARDILFMRDRLNLPIEYDQQRHGYFYSEPVKNFPAINLSEKELFSLLVAQKAMAQYKGSPYQKPLETAFKKITNLLSDNIYYCVKDLDKIVNFRPFVPEEADERKFELIHKAIERSRVISFDYRKLAASKAAVRYVRPYCIVCADNHWYLIGFDEQRDALRTFSFPRMDNLTLLERTFKKPKNFNIDEYLKGSLTIFKGTEDYEIVIELDRWGTDFLKGRILHESQQIIPIANGGSRVILRLNNIEEIERWILSMGVHATVLKPEKLVKKIAEDLEILATRYGLPSTKDFIEKDIKLYHLPGLSY